MMLVSSYNNILQVWSSGLFTDAEFFYAHLWLCKHLIHSVLHSLTEERKFVRGDRHGTAFLQRPPQNLQKRNFFSIFAFRCMVKWTLIGTEIGPVKSIKFSGLV